jgi:hypothetical protein
MNIVEAVSDVNLLGASIRDAESWKPWRALLAAAFGLPLSPPDELALYRACTARRVPPGEPFAYLWLVIGRRGGKSFAMALIAVFLAAFRDWRPKLSPGDCLACRGRSRTSQDPASVLPRHSQPADFAKLCPKCHRMRDRA